MNGQTYPVAATGETRRMNVKRAINETLREEMKRHPTVIILGCDVGVRGNPFGVTKGLYEEFGARSRARHPHQRGCHRGQFAGRGCDRVTADCGVPVQ